jgi:hypothetical protein
MEKEVTTEQEQESMQVSNPKIPIGLYIWDEYDCKGLILVVDFGLLLIMIMNCRLLMECSSEFCVIVHFG